MENLPIWKVPHLRYSNRSCCSGPNADCEGLNLSFRFGLPGITRSTCAARLIAAVSDSFPRFFLAEIPGRLVIGANRLLLAKFSGFASEAVLGGRKIFCRLFPKEIPVCETHSTCVLCSFDSSDQFPKRSFSGLLRFPTRLVVLTFSYEPAGSTAEPIFLIWSCCRLIPLGTFPSLANEPAFACLFSLPWPPA